MLVLSRRAGEAICIRNLGGDQVIIKVLNNDGQEVRLGISAPNNISVHRGEVQKRIDDKDKRND